jgi:hypothetical protein
MDTGNLENKYTASFFKARMYRFRLFCNGIGYVL